MKKRYIVLLKYENRGEKWSDWEAFDTEAEAERFQAESLGAIGSSTQCVRAVVICVDARGW